MTRSNGLLLFAHGARDPRWADPFVEVAARARAAAPRLAVELAFLEFMTPDLPAAARRLVDAGCGKVDIVPLFLGAGGHVRKDLPALVLALEAEHPDVTWCLHRAAGEQPGVIAALAEAALGLAATPPGPVGQSGAPSARQAP
jgi:sirohydrochlorin cobaltochelatase